MAETTAVKDVRIGSHPPLLLATPDALDEPIGERPSSWRKLVHRSAQVRPELPVCVAEIPDRPYLVQRLPVVVEQSRQHHLTCPRRSDASRSKEPARAVRKCPHR